MPPNWFKKVEFGQDITNFRHQDVVEDYLKKFRGELENVTFGSSISGPVIEEVSSDDETSGDDDAASVRSHHPTPMIEPQSDIESDLDSGLQNVISDAMDYNSESDTPQSTNQSHRSTDSIPDLGPAVLPPQPSPPSSPPPTSSIQPMPLTARVSPLRRSNRNRCKPLNFLRGERFIYDARGNIIKKEEGLPEKYDYSRKRPVPKGSELNFRQAKKGRFSYYFTEHSHHVYGLIKLEAGQTKPSARIGYDQSYTFRAERGEVQLIWQGRNGENICKISNNKPSIELPPGTKYVMKNVGRQMALINYVVF